MGEDVESILYKLLTVLLSLSIKSHQLFVKLESLKVFPLYVIVFPLKIWDSFGNFHISVPCLMVVSFNMLFFSE